MTDDLGRLTRLGFTSIPECLLCVPAGYMDCLEPSFVLPLPDTGIKKYLALTITSVNPSSKRLFMNVIDSCGDEVPIVIHQPSQAWQDLCAGDLVHIYGEVTTWKGKRQINSPMLLEKHVRGTVIPAYMGKARRISADAVRDGVAIALPHIDIAACLLIEQLGVRESEFRRLTSLNDPVDLLRQIHQPTSVRQGEHACKLAEVLSVQAIVNRAARNQSQFPVSGSLIPINRDEVTRLIGQLPFPLTGDQRTVIQEIVADLRSPFPMRRLLSGDVGTGKSLAFMVPAVAAYKANAKVAILVPNQLLAAQIAVEIRLYFPGIPVAEVIAGSKFAEGIMVGTTAILSMAKKHEIVFDFAIIDEQQKLSVGQKQALLAPHTNFLESTATAIPRTQALVQFGGVSLSILRECPVKRDIVSRIVPKAEAGRLFDFIERVVQKKGQIAIIYPLVEGKNSNIRASVESAFERFKNKMTGRVGMLHGKMPDTDKSDVINRMKSGELDVLISSTVIEVGVTLPSLRAVVVVHPERLGTSQMHQLRGRLARHGGKGYFFMFTPEEIEETAQERLNLLVECNDGFTLADRDTDLRGFGDIEQNSESQSGSTRILFWGVTLTRAEIESACSNQLNPIAKQQAAIAA